VDKTDKTARAGTVFVDEQILLMKSTIPEGRTLWKEFVDRNFVRKLVDLHRRFETVIIAFDYYEQVPLYKSIEQTRRVAGAKRPF